MKYLLLVPALFLANCSTVDIVAGSVTSYCDLPKESRMANREAVAVAVAPNRIEIECAE